MVVGGGCPRCSNRLSCIVAQQELELGMGEMLTILSGREATVRRLDTVRAAVGDDPARWYPMLTGAPWPGEDADELFLEAAE